MTIVRGNNAEKFEVPGVVVKKMAAPSTGANEILMFHAELQPGALNPTHVHDHEEIVYCMSGTMKGTIGDLEVELQAGDTMIVPPHVYHNLVNHSDTELEVICAMPAGTKNWDDKKQEMTPPPWTV